MKKKVLLAIVMVSLILSVMPPLSAPLPTVHLQQPKAASAAGIEIHELVKQMLKATAQHFAADDEINGPGCERESCWVNIYSPKENNLVSFRITLYFPHSPPFSAREAEETKSDWMDNYGEYMRSDLTTFNGCPAVYQKATECTEGSLTWWCSKEILYWGGGKNRFAFDNA